MEEKELPVITENEIEEQKKKSENVNKLLTPPEGYVLDGLRSFCPIHGEITYSNRTLEYTLFRKNEKGTVFPVTYRDVVCEACLADMWKKYCKETMPKDEKGEQMGVSVSPVFITKLEAKEKEVKMLGELLAELEKKNAPKEKLDKTKEMLEKSQAELAELEKAEEKEKAE